MAKRKLTAKVPQLRDNLSGVSRSMSSPDSCFVEALIDLKHPDEIADLIYRNKVKPYNSRLSKLRYSSQEEKLSSHMIQGAYLCQRIEAFILLKRKYLNGSKMRVNRDIGGRIELYLDDKLLPARTTS